MVQKEIIPKEQILGLVPQKPPFRFIDEIIEIDTDHTVATYRYRPDEFYYSGHFPGNPITPGVIMLETMAQVGVVVSGIYLLSFEYPLEEIDRFLALFTDAQVEFHLPVLPGERVTIRSKKLFWRQKKIRSQVQMFKDDGSLVANSTVSGMAVRK